MACDFVLFKHGHFTFFIQERSFLTGTMFVQWDGKELVSAACLACVCGCVCVWLCLCVSDNLGFLNLPVF